MIIVGASAYSRVIEFGRIRAAADRVGAAMFTDMAHIAGLVAGGVHPSPVPDSDFVSTTTHKTLRGPRGGMVLCRDQYAKDLDRAVFPGVQGGPLMHIIAAKAVCFKEAAEPVSPRTSVRSSPMPTISPMSSRRQGFGSSAAAPTTTSCSWTSSQRV